MEEEVDEEIGELDEQDNYLLLPLRRLKDYGKEPEIDMEKQRAKQKKLKPSKKEYVPGMPQVEGVDGDAPASEKMSSIEIEFSTSQQRGLQKALSKWEHMIVNADEKLIIAFFDMHGSKLLGLISTCSKSLYMKLKESTFPLHLNIKQFGLLSTNIVNGVGHGIVTNSIVMAGFNEEECDIDTVARLASFWNKAYPKRCTVKQLALKMDISVNEISLRTLMSSLQKPHSESLMHVSFEGSGMQLLGMKLLGDIMMQGKMPQLLSLNVSRNNGLYLGVHKIMNAISSQQCPVLHTLNVSANGAGVAILEFLDRKFREETTFLKHLYASDNLLDLYDNDAVNILTQAKLSFNHYETLDLSHNTLMDTEFVKLLRIVWPLENVKEFTGKPVNKPTCVMRNLLLDSTEFGPLSMIHLSELMMHDFMPSLQSMHLGNNAINVTAVQALLTPLAEKKLTTLERLYMPLNTIYADGLILMTASQTLGVFDNLLELDIAECGCSNDAIALFVKQVVERFMLGKLKLRRLKLFGIQPFPGKSARSLFPREFLMRVAVS
jgi:hypothetical protein